MNEENIHNRFEDINHRPLRVYNRVVMMHNLRSISRDEVTKYLNTFSDAERREMYMVVAYMKEHGVDATRKEATKGLEVVDG